MRGGSTPNASTIGSELLITGNVTSNGKIRLDGHVQGDIKCASLVLGENSQLKGSAVAEEVVVGGRLIGSVRAVRLMLQTTSHVEGDLLCQSLAIEQGAYFDGKSHRRVSSPAWPRSRPVRARRHRPSRSAGCRLTGVSVSRLCGTGLGCPPRCRGNACPLLPVVWQRVGIAGNTACD